MVELIGVVSLLLIYSIGIGFVATIVTVVLKLTGNLDTSWIWVFSPTWIPVLVVLVWDGFWLIIGGILEKVGVSMSLREFEEKE